MTGKTYTPRFTFFQNSMRISKMDKNCCMMFEVMTLQNNKQSNGAKSVMS